MINHSVSSIISPKSLMNLTIRNKTPYPSQCLYIEYRVSCVWITLWSHNQDYLLCNGQVHDNAITFVYLNLSFWLITNRLVFRPTSTMIPYVGWKWSHTHTHVPNRTKWTVRKLATLANLRYDICKETQRNHFEWQERHIIHVSLASPSNL